MGEASLWWRRGDRIKETEFLCATSNQIRQLQECGPIALGGGKGRGILSLQTAKKLPAKLVDEDGARMLMSAAGVTVNTVPALAYQILIMLLIQSTVGV